MLGLLGGMKGDDFWEDNKYFVVASPTAGFVSNHQKDWSLPTLETLRIYIVYFITFG